jgi:hypothetical protein
MTEEEKGKLLMETESFRAFLADDNKIDLKECFSLKYKDMELKLTGFIKVVNNNGNVIFLYKIKTDEKSVTYYKFDDITKEENEKFLIFIRAMNYLMRNKYVFVDMKPTLESIYQEQNILNKLADAEKAKDKKNG